MCRHRCVPLLCVHRAITRQGVATSSFVARVGQADPGFVRLETSWRFDDPDRMRTLRIGDAITRGGVGGAPMRFGGFQFGTNFAVQPGYLTLPLPSLSGSAALPSVADVYVNNVLRDRRTLPPGPFEIANVPVITGSGDVQLVVRDLLGRETVVTQSYYSSPGLLRRGLSDYSVEVGLLRRDFGRASNHYGALLVSASERVGLTDGLTAEAHGEATADTQMAGFGAELALPGIGVVEGSVAGSNSERGEGAEVRVGFERRTPHLSYGFVAELATPDFVTVGFLPDWRPPSATIQAFVGIPTRFGSLGLSYLRREGRSDRDVQLLSATGSVRLGRFGTLHLSARSNLRNGRDNAGELFLIIPFGHRTSASGGVRVHDGSAMLNALLQQNPPVGPGLGYRLEAGIGDVSRIEGRVTLQTDFGTYDAELSWVDGSTGARVSASGAIGVVQGTIFASRELTQSFATVRVGKYPGVRVYEDNQLVGTTNGSGEVVIPRLRPFDRNLIRLEVADLPMDAEIASPEMTVRPRDRSGVVADFHARRSRSAMARLLLDDGKPLPRDATLRLDGRPAEIVVAPGGEVYLSGLADRNRGAVTWSGGSCRIEFDFLHSRDAQPDLGDIRCHATRT